MDYAILFYVFAALTVLSAFVVVFARSIIYAAFSLLFTFLGVAGLYVLLSADFLAVVQIMVYVGGILVLLVFGVMLTRNATNIEVDTGTLKTLPALIIVSVTLALFIQLFTRTDWSVVDGIPEIDGTTMEIGEMLVTTYIMPFEVIGILLLVAIMGAALIARRSEVEKHV